MFGFNIDKQRIKEKLFSKKRLIILNEDTFEETFSIRLTLMNVFVALGLGAIIIIIVTIFIIFFTPLRELIPGYSSSKLKKNAMELALKSDSLNSALERNELYIQSIKEVLTGKLEFAKFNRDSILSIPNERPVEVDLSPSKTELEIRERVKTEEAEGKKVLTESKYKKLLSQRAEYKRKTGYKKRTYQTKKYKKKRYKKRKHRRRKKAEPTENKV